MKKIFFTVVSLLSFSSFACPNFQGEYVNEEFGTYYSIEQDACEVIHYIYDEGVVDAPVDGKEYLVNQYDVVVEEGKVLATVKIFSSNEFKKNKLIIKERSETTYTSGGVDRDAAWAEKFLNTANDLVTIKHSGNYSEINVDKRVK
jgi:hypothetical protein